MTRQNCETKTKADEIIARVQREADELIEKQNTQQKILKRVSDIMTIKMNRELSDKEVLALLDQELIDLIDGKRKENYWSYLMLSVKDPRTEEFIF